MSVTGNSIINMIFILIIIVIFLVILFWVLDRFLIMDGGILVYATSDDKKDQEDNQDKLTDALKDYCNNLDVEFDNDTEIVLCQLKNDTSNS